MGPTPGQKLQLHPKYLTYSKVVIETQRFLGAHAAVLNIFNLGRHKGGAQHYRDLRISAFEEWSGAAG
jgi:hypothetical protein